MKRSRPGLTSREVIQILLSFLIEIIVASTLWRAAFALGAILVLVGVIYLVWVPPRKQCSAWIRALKSVPGVGPIVAGAALVGLMAFPPSIVRGHVASPPGKSAARVHAVILVPGSDDLGYGVVTDDAGRFQARRPRNQEYSVVTFLQDGDSTRYSETKGSAAGMEASSLECAYPCNSCFSQEFRPVRFEHNLSSLSWEARAQLDQLASYLRNNLDMCVLLSGGASQIGFASYNQKLAGKRAKECRRYLLAAGVSPRQLVPCSFGTRDPVISGFTDEANRANRRVEFVLLPSAAIASQCVAERALAERAD